MAFNIVLASANQDRLASWTKGLRNDVYNISLINNFDILRNDIAKIHPQVLLLDFDLFGSNCLTGVAILRETCSEAKTIIMNGGLAEEVEWKLLKAGIRGICKYDVNPEYLEQAIMAVHQGEMWLRRSLTNRLLDEFGKTSSKNLAYRNTLGLLNKLTQREYDIAVRAGNGESNKEIAHACAITERTVKAHLSEIYNKLGVSDRINLALALSADNRNPSADSGKTANPEISSQLLLGGSRFNDKSNGNP